MIAISSRLVNASFGAATLLTGFLLASCDPQYSTPQLVETSNPTVTYKYRSDQELVQANQKAANFCDRYQAVPRTANFANDPDGSRIVIFNCVQPTPVAVSRSPVNPNLTYNYRTDEELLNASRTAQIYCANNGSRQVVSNIVTNGNGTRTVTFQCTPG